MQCKNTIIFYILRKHRKQTLKPSVAVNPASFTHSSADQQETTADGNFAMTLCSAYSTVNSSQPPLANTPPLDDTINNDSTYSSIREMQVADPPQEYEPIDQL